MFSKEKSLSNFIFDNKLTLKSTNFCWNVIINKPNNKYSST